MKKIEYRKYLNSKHWQEVKRKHKERKCEICESPYLLNLHHLKYNNLNKEKADDLATLCEFCHLASHIHLTRTKKLRKPSDACRIIIFKIRDKKGLKREQISLFLRRRYIAQYGTKKMPSMDMFRKIAIRNSAKIYPFKRPRYFIPENLEETFSLLKLNPT